jgi:hypothetical protein
MARDPKTESSEIVVFWTVSDSACAECGRELWKGSFLRLEEGKPLCLSCADLGHLAYLPSGDAALTRRATRYSRLRAVVVRFSRARKRYERQGVLVEEEALERAERECLEDAESRRRARERAALRRAAAEDAYTAAFAARIAELYPGCPPDERASIAAHACAVGSGRIGRTGAAKELDPGAVELAVRARVRHRHTPYDDLLADGMDRSEARDRVRDCVEAVLARWTAPGAATTEDGG